MAMKMNFIDLQAQYKELKDEITQAMDQVLDSCQFINGPDVAGLEKEMSEFCGTKHGIGVSSGTDALYIALMALGIGPGDEVITTPFTFIATAEVVSLLGATPVFADIDDKTLNIDPSKIEEKVTEKTKSIIPVHLYGQCADMDAILALAEKKGIPVIEDAAQAIGSEYKGKRACSMGTMGCLSFFPSKNLGCYGDGGMIMTADSDLSVKLQQLRNHGQDKKYSHKYIGVNGRLDTLQAAVLRVKLKYLEKALDARVRLADRYSAELKDVVNVPFREEHNRHVYNQYTIRTPDRDKLQQHCLDNGVPIAVHYPMPLHLQESFKSLGYKEGDFPVAEKAAKEVMSLPMFPEMTEEQQDIVIKTIKSLKV